MSSPFPSASRHPSPDERGRAGILAIADGVTGIPRITLLLVVAAQLADLATFGITASLIGASGEIGPLGSLYRSGGFAAVALAKSTAILAMVAMLVIYGKRTRRGRWLALAVAAAGLFGALTNVIALL